MLSIPTEAVASPIIPPDTEASDEDLLRRIVRRDETALAALYARHRPLAFSQAIRVLGDAALAEDVLQDAFLSVWRKAHTYQTGRGSVRTWVSSIVRNRAIDIVRARRERAVADDEELLLGIRDPGPAVVDQVVASIEGEMTRTALSTLPSEQCEAVSLAFLGGLSHSEIVERTGLPLGTVKSRVRLGIQRMRQLMVPVAA